MRIRRHKAKLCRIVYVSSSVGQEICQLPGDDERMSNKQPEGDVPEVLYKFVNPLSILIMQHNNNNETYTTDKNKRNRTARSYAPNFAYATATQLQTHRPGKKKFTCTTTLFLPFVCTHFVFCLLLLLLHHVSLCPIALYAHACNQRYS